MQLVTANVNVFLTSMPRTAFTPTTTIFELSKNTQASNVCALAIWLVRHKRHKSTAICQFTMICGSILPRVKVYEGVHKIGQNTDRIMFQVVTKFEILQQETRETP
jgi:hypothetical protein